MSEALGTCQPADATAEAWEQGARAERQRIAKMARQEADLYEITAEEASELGLVAEKTKQYASAEALRAFADKITKGE